MLLTQCLINSNWEQSQTTERHNKKRIKYAKVLLISYRGYNYEQVLLLTSAPNIYKGFNY